MSWISTSTSTSTHKRQQSSSTISSYLSINSPTIPISTPTTFGSIDNVAPRISLDIEDLSKSRSRGDDGTSRIGDFDGISKSVITNEKNTNVNNSMGSLFGLDFSSWKTGEENGNVNLSDLFTSVWDQAASGFGSVGTKSEYSSAPSPSSSSLQQKQHKQQDQSQSPQSLLESPRYGRQQTPIGLISNSTPIHQNEHQSNYYQTPSPASHHQKRRSVSRLSAGSSFVSFAEGGDVIINDNSSVISDTDEFVKGRRGRSRWSGVGSGTGGGTIGIGIGSNLSNRSSLGGERDADVHDHVGDSDDDERKSVGSLYREQQHQRKRNSFLRSTGPGINVNTDHDGLESTHDHDRNDGNHHLPPSSPVLGGGLGLSGAWWQRNRNRRKRSPSAATCGSRSTISTVGSLFDQEVSGGGSAVAQSSGGHGHGHGLGHLTHSVSMGSLQQVAQAQASRSPTAPSPTPSAPATTTYSRRRRAPTFFEVLSAAESRQNSSSSVSSTAPSRFIPPPVVDEEESNERGRGVTSFNRGFGAGGGGKSKNGGDGVQKDRKSRRSEQQLQQQERGGRRGRSSERDRDRLIGTAAVRANTYDEDGGGSGRGLGFWRSLSPARVASFRKGRNEEVRESVDQHHQHGTEVHDGDVSTANDGSVSGRTFFGIGRKVTVPTVTTPVGRSRLSVSEVGDDGGKLSPAASSPYYSGNSSSLRAASMSVSVDGQGGRDEKGTPRSSNSGESTPRGLEPALTKTPPLLAIAGGGSAIGGPGTSASCMSSPSASPTSHSLDASNVTTLVDIQKPVSRSPPPPKLDFESRASNFRGRRSAIQEFITTERTYVGELSVMMKLYIEPMRASPEVEDSMLSALFANIAGILEACATNISANESGIHTAALSVTIPTAGSLAFRAPDLSDLNLIMSPLFTPPPPPTALPPSPPPPSASPSFGSNGQFLPQINVSGPIVSGQVFTALSTMTTTAKAGYVASPSPVSSGYSIPYAPPVASITTNTTTVTAGVASVNAQREVLNSSNVAAVVSSSVETPTPTPSLHQVHHQHLQHLQHSTSLGGGSSVGNYLEWDHNVNNSDMVDWAHRLCNNVGDGVTTTLATTTTTSNIMSSVQNLQSQSQNQVPSPSPSASNSPFSSLSRSRKDSGWGTPRSSLSLAEGKDGGCDDGGSASVSSMSRRERERERERGRERDREMDWLRNRTPERGGIVKTLLKGGGIGNLGMGDGELDSEMASLMKQAWIALSPGDGGEKDKEQSRGRAVAGTGNSGNGSGASDRERKLGGLARIRSRSRSKSKVRSVNVRERERRGSVGSNSNSVVATSDKSSVRPAVVVAGNGATGTGTGAIAMCLAAVMKSVAEGAFVTEKPLSPLDRAILGVAKVFCALCESNFFTWYDAYVARLDVAVNLAAELMNSELVNAAMSLSGGDDGASGNNSTDGGIVDGDYGSGANSIHSATTAVSVSATSPSGLTTSFPSLGRLVKKISTGEISNSGASTVVSFASASSSSVTHATMLSGQQQHHQGHGQRGHGRMNSASASVSNSPAGSPTFAPHPLIQHSDPSPGSPVSTTSFAWNAYHTSGNAGGGVMPIPLQPVSGVSSYSYGDKNGLARWGRNGVLAAAKVVGEAMADSRHRQINLGAYLLLPIQRITRYAILFDRLLEYIPNDHAIYDIVKTAGTKVRAAVEQCNEARRRANTLVDRQSFTKLPSPTPTLNSLPEIDPESPDDVFPDRTAQAKGKQVTRDDVDNIYNIDQSFYSINYCPIDFAINWEDFQYYGKKAQGEIIQGRLRYGG
ncbi:hypothetical protein HDU76_012639 [Blyttiomyces sp. JEL0837]|nr:hypothetical protein HDU76_012639 [Blyttiomyces sp. JEL0837]